MSKEHKKRGLWLQLAMMIFCSLIIAVGVSLIITKEHLPTQTLPDPSQHGASKPAVLVNDYSQSSDQDVTWVEPQKLDDLHLVITSLDMAGVSYYKIADLKSGGELILGQISWDSPSTPVLIRFEKDPQGNYIYLAKCSETDLITDLTTATKYLQLTVKYNNTISYQAISAPASIKIGNTTFNLYAYNTGFFSDLSNPEKISDTEYGPLYETFPNGKKDAFDSCVIYLKLADSTYRNFTLQKTFFTDDNVPRITWSNGDQNINKYNASWAGCGALQGNSVVVDDKNLTSRLQEMGQTSTGEKIYSVSSDDSIMKQAYNTYKEGRTDDIISYTQFVTEKPLFIWQDGLGRYLIFVNDNFNALAECGKPVIYLYPEKPTNVSVKVDAKITKSDPLYQNGWQVLAQPDGQLSVNGKNYDSLFWEGRGQNYPVVRSGTIVKKEDIKITLQNQLTKLGLNSKEKADFMAFWLPKMPKTPYVRLTWFGTQDMNQLAPLTITPRPDTIIRIFLDFEGLQAPISLPKQTLSAPQRKGFTVIEWGGLLRNN
jgi:hypothetical protein